MGRSISVKLAAAGLCAGLIIMAAPAVAGANPSHIRGVVPARTAAGQQYAAQHSVQRFVFRLRNLFNHGGPVMHADANYAIFWEPAGHTSTATYKTIINGYFSNVAAAAGSLSNDYGVATQYHDSSGFIKYNSTFGGAATDTDPYPASGCAAGGGEPCITDAQLETELNSYLSANGLPRGMGTEYFVFLPPGVATCISGSECSTNVFCAYHSWFGSGGASEVLYANMPYAGVPGCKSGQYPNGDVGADSTINVTSHENIETITDPLGTAWFDLVGQEIGDKCAWNFGGALGGSSGALFNEAIGTGHYWLQQEYSNLTAGCVQHL
jgi:hypothetical protein